MVSTTIHVTFKNGSGENRKYDILDLGRTPPRRIFRDFLDPGESTDPLVIDSEDGVTGKAQYQSAGGPQVVVDVKDGDTVVMK